jgi:hypothetical protein
MTQNNETLANLINTEELATRCTALGLPSDTSLDLYLRIEAQSVSLLTQCAVNLTRGEITKDDMQTIIDENFPSDKKTANRRGAHMLSLCRTGKITVDFTPAKSERARKPISLDDFTKMFNRLSEDDQATFLAAQIAAE